MVTFTAWPAIPATGAYPHSCEWRGKTYRSNHRQALSDLARQLKADDCDNQPWQVVWQDEPDRVTLKGPNLDWLAGHVLAESAKGLHWRPWAPFPGDRSDATGAAGPDPVSE